MMLLHDVMATEKKEQKTFLRRLRQCLHQEIHLKIEGDDSPVLYILREVGKDYLVVSFAENERVIPFNKIIYFLFDLG